MSNLWLKVGSYMLLLRTVIGTWCDKQRVTEGPVKLSVEGIETSKSPKLSSSKFGKLESKVTEESPVAPYMGRGGEDATSFSICSFGGLKPQNGLSVPLKVLMTVCKSPPLVDDQSQSSSKAMNSWRKHHLPIRCPLVVPEPGCLLRGIEIPLPVAQLFKVPCLILMLATTNQLQFPVSN